MTGKPHKTFIPKNIQRTLNNRLGPEWVRYSDKEQVTLAQVREARILLNGALKCLRIGWTSGKYAINADGKQTTPEGSQAVAWCAVGAMYYARGEFPIRVDTYATDATAVCDVAYVLILLGQRQRVNIRISAWNDARGRTQAQVVGAFGHAVTLCDLLEKELS